MRTLWALVGLIGIVAGLTAADEVPAGFTPLFNGKDLSGWRVIGGKADGWGVEGGIVFTTGKGGGWLLTDKEYADFELRLEYKMPVNGNSGVGLRAPEKGDPAYVGMEIQLLDDNGPAWAKLRPVQYTGSIYDVVPAKKGSCKMAGEWNQMTIVCNGRKVVVNQNGMEILNSDLDELQEHYKKHPGLTRTTGFIGLQSHGSRTEFRNVVIKLLP